METGALISKISAVAPGAYLYKNRFGRSGHLCVWLDLHKIREVASFLCHDPGIGLDWLENMSVAQVENTLVLTYFVRSRRDASFSMILRGTVPLEGRSGEMEWVDVPSVADVWLSALPAEQEYRELFGIRFNGNSEEANSLTQEAENRLLPKGWRGFPLRKDYVFPKEVLGIQHSRKDKNV